MKSFGLFLVAFSVSILLGCAASANRNIIVRVDSGLPANCNCSSLGAISDSDIAHNRSDQIEGLKDQCRDLGGNYVVVDSTLLFGTDAVYTLPGRAYKCPESCQ